LKTYWCVNVLPFHYQFLLSSSSIEISNRNLFFPRFLSPFLLILSLLVEMRTSKHIYNICISHTYRIYVIYCSRIETGNDIWTYRDDKMISTCSRQLQTKMNTMFCRFFLAPYFLSALCRLFVAFL
jgi:hypothetical protein